MPVPMTRATLAASSSWSPRSSPLRKGGRRRAPRRDRPFRRRRTSSAGRSARPTRGTAEIVDYARRVAAVSPRVRLTSYGRTAEGRDLVLLAVTSPENHARMGELEARYRKLADPRKLDPGEDIEEARRPTSRSSCGSPTTSTGTRPPRPSARCRCSTGSRRRTTPRRRSWLSEAIVLIDPCLNPDGHDRYVNWFRGEAGRRADPDPDAREHDEPWPGGRTNHFQFDLNRDWAFATQIETRGPPPALRRAGRRRSTSTSTRCRAESTYFFFPGRKADQRELPASHREVGQDLRPGQRGRVRRAGAAVLHRRRTSTSSTRATAIRGPRSPAPSG